MQSDFQKKKEIADKFDNDPYLVDLTSRRRALVLEKSKLENELGRINVGIAILDRKIDKVVKSWLK